MMHTAETVVIAPNDRYAGITMNQQEMVVSLQAEIARLQQVVDLLTEQPAESPQSKGPGRPRKVAQAPSSHPETPIPAVRRMSPEGKARIAAAQKKRWAKQKAVTAALAKKTSLSKQTKKALPVPTKKSPGKKALKLPIKASVSKPMAKRALVAPAKKLAPKKASKSDVKRSASQTPASPAPADTTE